MRCEDVRNAAARSFGDIPPVGFLLREAYPERWLRIHSLPESRRLPDNDADHLEILRRHNAVASDLLGTGTECVVLALSPAGEPMHTDLRPWEFTECLPLPQALWAEEDGYFAGPMSLFAASVVWTPGVADDLIRASALDQVSIVVLNVTTGRAYAPYDGGADLLFASAPERDAARERYLDWLSPHAHGL